MIIAQGVHVMVRVVSDGRTDSARPNQGGA
ncbi:hypothetical protein EV681_0098 [Advenella incenata]|jgi:hypothetical protein|uniref:Uncharacterized protein n=1 Tax=Advenella incenata TaxID=267800 RepID=A0A4Q7VPN5_9BURK|nr:hypothetical protein EV681_0098 [Advenella incenata]